MNVRVLWEWWVRQLGECIPDGLRQRLEGRRDALVVDLGKDAAEVHAVVGGKRCPIGHCGPGTTDRWRATLLAALGGLPNRPSNLEIRIPPGSYLRRDLDLPFAAEGSLREAVELKLDRLTPFNPDEVVFQCGVRDRDPATKRLGVWLAAVPAGQVHDTLEWLGEPPGRAPRPPRRAPPPDGPLVLRYALSRERRLGRGWLVAAANLALLVAVAVVHHQNDRAGLLALETALAEVRRDAAEAAELAVALEQKRAAVATVHDRRTARPPLVEVLEDLSVRLPDDTYLQRFEVRHGEARLFGISATASNLIRQLEVSPLLADVRFESSVTRDVASGRERFSIVARLVPAAASAETREPGS
jgi:general secretion pathway protein L